MQENEILKQFGKHIKSIRESKNLNISYAHYKGGVNPSTVSRIENGEVEPKLLTLIKLSKALGINLPDMLKFNY